MRLPIRSVVAGTLLFATACAHTPAAPAYDRPAPNASPDTSSVDAYIEQHLARVGAAPPAQVRAWPLIAMVLYKEETAPYAEWLLREHHGLDERTRALLLMQRVLWEREARDSVTDLLSRAEARYRLERRRADRLERLLQRAARPVSAAAPHDRVPEGVLSVRLGTEYLSFPDVTLLCYEPPRACLRLEDILRRPGKRE